MLPDFSQPSFDDLGLLPIYDKVKAGERLSYEDGLTLFRSPDLLAIGHMANIVRERLHGNVTYFNVNRHINPTDVCVASCKLCAFGKKAKDPNAYTMSLEDRSGRVPDTASAKPSPSSISSADSTPNSPSTGSARCCAASRSAIPQVHLKAFTMVEIAYFHKRFKIPIEEVLRRFKEAGMDSMPGGGAEIFCERVRRIICDHKIDGGEWLEIARLAHKMGVKSNCTMLYGHIETEEDRVDHLVRLRASRTTPAASSPSFLWPSIPTTRRSSTSPKPPASTTSRTLPSPA
ncbi:MAG: hypothetical protein QM757_02230 [Paludibaculum sp.]